MKGWVRIFATEEWFAASRSSERMRRELGVLTKGAPSDSEKTEPKEINFLSFSKGIVNDAQCKMGEAPHCAAALGIAAGVKPRHGASENPAVTHISICEEKDPGVVIVWQEAVTDEQYAGR